MDEVFQSPHRAAHDGSRQQLDGVEWRIKEMAQLLASPAARQNLVRDIVEFAVESHQAGIVVDFEEVPDASQAHFRASSAGWRPHCTPWG